MGKFIALHVYSRENLGILAGGFVLFCVIGVLCSHMWMHRFFNVDDVYITYRYAENFSNGLGFVFNEGERVEGSSNFLYVILLSIPLALGAEPVVTSKIIGAAATITLLVFVFLFVRLIFNDIWGYVLGVGAALLLAASTPIAAWSMCGMETNVYACLLLAGIYFYVRFLEAKASPKVWPILFAVASMTRPEGFAFFFLILFLNLIKDLLTTRKIKESTLRNLKHLFWFSVIFGPFLLFRFLYFGELLPNSVIAKNTFQKKLMDAPLTEEFRMVFKGRGFKAVKGFLTNRFGFSLLIVFLPFLLRRARWSNFILLASALGVCAVCVWNEGGWMPHRRLLVPMIPLLFVSVALGLRVVFEIDSDRASARWMALVFAVVVFLIFSLKLYYHRKPEKNDYKRHLAIIEMGKKMGAARAKDDILATDIAGRVAFYSKMKTIDMMGLCDKHIAHHGGDGGLYGRQDKEYVLGYNPTFIVVNNPREWGRLLRLKGFRDKYWLIKMPDYWRLRKILFVRKERENIDELLGLLEGRLVDPAKELKERTKKR